MPLFFTHIPKTAGTSFKQGVIFPNVDPGKILRFNGIRALIRDRGKPFEFLDGHYPYGVHRFGNHSTPVVYATILREPLDRAISHYYFTKQCDTEDYQHPSLEDAKHWDLAEFNARQKYRNLQTKFTAGLLATKLAGLAALPEKLLLARAKYNLANKYDFVGIVDRMPEFEEMVAKELGWRRLSLRDHSKVTKNRPATGSINAATKASILRANQLDVQLYEFARNLFAERAAHFFGHDSITAKRNATAAGTP